MADRRRRRAMTLVEVLIASAIGASVMAVIIYTIAYSMRVSQANFAQLHAGMASQRFYEHVAYHTRRAKRIVVAPDGLSVALTLEPEIAGGSDVVCSYTFQDGDGDANTIADNRIRFATTSGHEIDETIASGVSPGPAGWIFQPDNPRPILIVSFRIGDPTNDLGHPSNAITGPGTQGVNVTARVTPRNLHLWGG